jgi:hypothetical protein
MTNPANIWTTTPVRKERASSSRAAVRPGPQFLTHLGLALLLVAALLPRPTHAATKTAGNGNWSAAGTWSPSGVPGAADSVYVPGAANLALDVNGTCGAINILGGFTFGGSANLTLTVTASSGMSGNFYSSGNINNFGSASGQVVYIAGILNLSGGNFGTGSGSKIVFNGTGTKTYTNSNIVQTLEVNGAGLVLQLSSNALINANLTITAGTLDLGSYTANRQNAGGTIAVAAGATLKIGGTNSFPSPYTTISLASASTVEYSGTSQTVMSNSYGNLTLSGSGTKTLPGGGLSIAGNFTCSGTATGSSGSALTVNGAFTINSGATFTAATYAHSVKGDFSNSGTFFANMSSMTLNGTSSQSIGGSTSTTFYNLSVNNSNGVTLNTATGVSGTLTFTSGNITTNANIFSIGSAGSVSRTSGHVVGYFQKYIATGATTKTFEIGTGTNYTPLTVVFGNVTVAGNLIASTAAGDHANIASSTIDPSKSVNRTWTLTNSGVTFTNYSATFTFVAGDMDAGASQGNFIVGKWSGSSWSYPTVGTRTALSTQITGVTSFSDFQIGEIKPTYTVSGTVFEDVNYAGGSGRTRVASSGVIRSGARVELFDNSGTFSTSTTTDASGNYSFAGLFAQNYTIRVVTDSVSSSRTGYTTSCKPVMTYRTDASTGTAVNVTDYVGGHDPSTADAIRAAGGWILNAATGAFSGSGSGKAHAFAPVTVSTANVTGVDFGFNFNTVTNTNNSGQGSIRQAITNMNTLADDLSLAQPGLFNGKDNAVFMISNGTSAAGLRSANSYFSGGIATISPTSALPTLSTVMVLDAQNQPGWAIAPVIELNGTNAGGSSIGLNITGGNCIVRGLIVNRFGSFGIQLSSNGSNIIAGNYIGVNSAGTSAAANGNDGISILTGNSDQIGGTTATDRNVISGNNNAGNLADGIWINGGTGHTIQGNYLGANAAGTGSIPNYHAGMSVTGGSNMVIGGTVAGASNLIMGNGSAGVIVQSATGIAILGNSIYGNTNLGIDLGDDGVTANNGTKNGSLPNSDMDYPVFTSAILSGTSLTVTGYVGSAPGQSTFGSARVELFKSDNNASGYGEGQTYLGFVASDASGNINSSLTVSGLTAGDKITATATDGSNNTSEFGANFGISVVYYSKGNLPVNTPANWNTKRDGTGTDASSFGTRNSWVIQNAHAMTLSGSTSWDVSSSGVVEIESGGSWMNTSSGAITLGTLQVDNGGTYSHGTTTTLPGATHVFAATSTINYSASANQTIALESYGHLVVSGSGTKTLAGNVNVAGDLSVAGGTMALSSYTANRSTVGGTLTVSNGATLQIGGTNGFPSNYTSHALGSTSIVEYAGTNQSIAAENYGYLTLTGAGTKTASAGITALADLTIGSGSTFAAGTFSHTIQGNWSNSGTLSAGTSTITLSGSSNSTVSGSNTFSSLSLSKSSASTTVTLNSPTSTSTMVMTQGTLAAGSNGITITSDRSGSGIITGSITRTHTFNTGASYAFESPYNTITLASGGTLPTSMTVIVALGSPGSTTSMEPINRYYDVSQAGGSGFSFTFRLHYENSEIVSPNSESSPPLKIWRRTATSPDVWDRKGATANDTVNNWVEMSGLTELGTYTLSSRTMPNVVLTLAQDATYPPPGATVTYTLTYSNTGDGSAGSTLITASAPAHTTYVPGSVVVNGVSKTDAADADEVSVSGGTITINIGSLASGGSGTVSYRVTIQ